MFGNYFLFVVLCSAVQCHSSSQNLTDFLVKRTVKECVVSDYQFSCFANKAAKAIERCMNWDLVLFDGVKFLRNKREMIEEGVRSSKSGWIRLARALRNFLDSHYFSVDLTDGDSEARGGGGVGGEGGSFGLSGFGISGQALKKEIKYAQYTFMVLLGIFGLTGPVIMKTLGAMAAKALIASKMALIIVGSVALKKIFEKDDKKTSVKIHSFGHDHDRIFSSNKSVWPYDP